jgi:tetratricopeptide (TPR) repeat protein
MAQADVRARRQLREGCGAYLACFGCLAAVVIAFAIFGRLSAFGSRLLIDPASVDVAFVNLHGLIGQFVLYAGLTLLFGFLLMAVAWDRSKLLGALVAIPLLAAMGWTIWSTLYDDFIALRARDGSVQLLYRWPRPMVALNGSDVKTTSREKVPAPNPMATWRYQLTIDTATHGYHSAVTSEGPVVRGQVLIRREQHAHRASHGPEAIRLDALGKLALIHLRLGAREKGLATAREALAIAEANGDQAAIASALLTLGIDARDHGQLDTAESMLRRSFEIRRRILDSEHPDWYDSYDAYAAVLQARGMTRDQVMDVLGPQPPRTIATEMRREGLTQDEADARVRKMIEDRKNED